MSKSFIDTPKFRQHNHHNIIKHLKYKRQNHATSHKYFYTCTFKYLYKVQSMNQIKPQQLSIALTRLTLSLEFFFYNKPAVSSIDALNHFGALKIPFLRHIFTTLPKLIWSQDDLISCIEVLYILPSLYDFSHSFISTNSW